MSPETNVTPESSSGDMIRASRRGSVPRSNATTGTPSRTSWRTVHAPMQPSAPVTKKRSADRPAAVVMSPPCGRGVDGSCGAGRTTTSGSFSILVIGPRIGRYATLGSDVNGSPDAGGPRPDPRPITGQTWSLMTIDHAERVPLGRTGLEVSRLGFGGASIGGLFSAVDDASAIETVRHAWSLGVRTFDTAPLYGYGASERRMGAALAGQPRDAFVLSTKVGRLVRATAGIPAGADIDRQALDGREDAYYVVRDPVRIVFDYSADGVRRSLEESLERLRLDRIDIALIHDPDDHWRGAIEGAWPALERLRVGGRDPAPSAPA